MKALKEKIKIAIIKIMINQECMDKFEGGNTLFTSSVKLYQIQCSGICAIPMITYKYIPITILGIHCGKIINYISQ